MTSDKVSVFCKLEIELNEVCVLNERIGITGMSVLWINARSSSVSNQQWSCFIVEVLGITDNTVCNSA